MKLTVNKRLRNTALLKNIPKLLLQQSPTGYTQSKVEITENQETSSKTKITIQQTLEQLSL